MQDLMRIFGSSILHDYEIDKIEINYSGGTIFFQFIDSKNRMNKYVIKNFISINFTKNEDWGKGKYVVSSDVFCIDGIWNIEIQLNSGDICNVKCHE